MKKILILSIMTLTIPLFAFAQPIGNSNYNYPTLTDENDDLGQEENEEEVWQEEAQNYVEKNYGSTESSKYIGNPNEYDSNFGGDSFDKGY